MLTKRYKIILGIFLFLLVPIKVSAATATISNLQAEPSTTKYNKIEFTFSLSKEYENPFYYYDATDTAGNNPSKMSWYGVNGVSVDAKITTPSGRQIAVPAFYFQDYKRIKVGAQDIVGKYKNPVWKVRFAPNETGTYKFYLTVTDKEGTTRYPTSGDNAFTVTNSTSKGFLKVSSSDPRFIEYDNGDTFVPISRGTPWEDYETLFPAYKQNGINFIRLWDTSDFALGVEGAQTAWVDSNTMDVPAKGIVVGSGANEGLRSANPTSPWYQRIAISEPTKQHKIEGYVKGTGKIRITSVQSNLILGSTIIETGSGGTNYTYVSATFTPNTDRVAVYLPTGSEYDQISIGPILGNSIEYNILTDGNFERHFAKDNTNNDPNANINLQRPLGNYFNQDESYRLDKILESAQNNDVYIQLCSCSGPWFTWPGNPESPDEWDWSSSWVLKSWQRNFRYRVARWGYSTSVLAWEKHNEHGHVTPNTNMYNFYQNYSNYQKSIDIYNHLKTTSQGSQAFSPNFWSSAAFDLANYHDYMMSNRYAAALNNDEANFVNKFAWCLASKGTYCDSNLGVGDGTSWISTAPFKPWVWGEIGVGTTVWNEPNSKGTTGEGAIRVFRNTMWAGLLSPMATTPVNWYDTKDSSYTNTVNAQKKIASDFFKGINLSKGNVTFLTTTADKPSNYNGESITVSNSTTRVIAAKFANKKESYLWVQNKNNTWFNSPTVPAAINTSVTIPNMNNESYVVETWNTSTGAKSTTNVSGTGGTLTFNVSSLTSDVAVKVIATNNPIPSITPSPTIVPSPIVTPGESNDLNNDGKIDITDVIDLVKRIFDDTYTFVNPQANPDINKDNKVNLMDIISLIQLIFGIGDPTPTPSPTASVTPTTVVTPTVIPTPSVSPTVVPTPTSTPAPIGSTWSQHAANAQRTSYVDKEMPTPWKWSWSWNGPNNSGGVSSGKFGLPRNVQAVTGGGKVYVAAGSRGLYALNESDGSQSWVFNQATVNSTAAFDNNFVYAVGTNGYLYQLNYVNGSVVNSFNLGSTSTLPLPVAVSGNSLYVGMGRYVYSLNKNNLTQNWRYDTGGSVVNTPVSFSASKSTAIVVTQDLYVHAINSTGNQKWRVKPTTRVYGNPQGDGGNNFAEATYGWPVIAENSGLVLIKYRLDWNTMFEFGRWPTTNEQIRSNLTSQPDQQALFALNIDTGNVPFISNIGHGGWGDGGYMPMGPQPVVKKLSDGKEVVYTVGRGDNRYDERWDSELVEMVLDNSTISGLQPGYIRWIEYCNYGWAEYANSNCFVQPTDEQPNVSMAGNQLMAAHWALAFGVNIRNRASSYGSYTNPIDTTALPSMATVTLSSAVGNFSSTHYSPNSFPMATTDGEYRSLAPGFYIYINQGKIYDQYWRSYASWTISDGKVYYLSNEGTLVALTAQ